LDNGRVALNAFNRLEKIVFIDQQSHDVIAALNVFPPKSPASWAGLFVSRQRPSLGPSAAMFIFGPTSAKKKTGRVDT
jgi:hypothetical protein